MKIYKAVETLGLSLALLLASNLAIADANGRIQLELMNDGQPLPSGQIRLEFRLMDNEGKRALTDRDLTIENEKLLHMFVFDPSLIEFRHLHPDYAKGKWSVDVDLPVNGSYWVWAQGKLISDGEDFSTSTRQSVQGGLPEHPIVELQDIRIGKDHGSVVELSKNTIRTNRMTMLTLMLSREDGTPSDLSDYLGSKAHIVSVPMTGDELIHVHAMATSIPNQLMIHSTFPKAGKYRIWVQFIDGGCLKVVPLAVAVSN